MFSIRGGHVANQEIQFLFLIFWAEEGGGVREWKSKQKCVQRSADRGCPPLPEFAKICQQKTEGKDKKWSIKDKM